MGKKGSKDGVGIYLTYIVFIIIGAIITLTSNMLNFSAVYSYGLNQYISNIWHGHHDYYCQSTSKIKVFNKIIGAKNIESQDYALAFSKNKKFKFKGYIAKENITWIAIEIYHKNKRINGYFVIPKKASDRKFWVDKPFKDDKSFRRNYFGYYKAETVEKIKNDLLLVWKRDCLRKFPVKKETNSVKIQGLRESKEHRIIDYISDDNVVYYTDANSYNKVEDFYNMYVGDNFDTFILQAKNDYNPKIDGVYEASYMDKILSKWYFKIGLLIFLIFILMSIFSALFSEKVKCPKCESSDISEGESKEIGKTYKHTKKDGKQDLRYKENPIMIRFRRSILCNDCSHRWSITYNQVQN